MPSPTDRRQCRQPLRSAHAALGFTLIEVLVALAIVALTLGAGLQAAAALTRNAQRLGEVSEAQWCADNRLAALRLTRQFPDIGDIEFECRQLGRIYLGKLIVRPTPNPNFRRVDATIGDDQAVPLLTVSTVIGRF